MMNRWRFPSLSLHGIEGAFVDPESKTVIPRKVTAKFSIRLVLNMDEGKVEKLVKTHLESVFAKLGSPNKLPGSRSRSKTPQDMSGLSGFSARFERFFFG